MEEKSLLLSCVLVQWIQYVLILQAAPQVGTGQWDAMRGGCQGTCQANELPSTSDRLIMADGTGLCVGGQANAACG